jgi:hypothetical protein
MRAGRKTTNPSEIAQGFIWGKGPKGRTNGLGSGGWSGSKLICFWGRVKGYPCQVLLDFGSTKNCMSSKFAARAGVALQGVTIGTILLADATPRSKEQTRGEEILRLGAVYAEPIRFKVTSLKYDIILGLPWLEKGNKRVDWEARTVTFTKGTQRIIL